MDITTRVVGWDERVVYLEQIFARGGDLCARGLVAGRFLTRGNGARVPAPEVMAELDPDVVAPQLPADVAGWADAIGVAHRPTGVAAGVEQGGVETGAPRPS